MTERILGEAGPKRRWRFRFVFLPVLLGAALALFMAGGALAVHDTGVFQLDGNASSALQSTPNALEDWDVICNAHSTGPSATCTKNPAYDFTTVPATTTATRSAFITDGFLSQSDNIYKGGTDDADVNTWLWKQAGPSPDKDDIEHAFAAEYTVTTAGPYLNHKVLFFGGDRLANVGSTNIGLWFFQQAVSTGGTKTGVDANGNPTCSVNSGCGFTGTHTVGNKSLGGTTAGDLFILSAFTNGGAQPTIKVFEWVGPGNATKDYLGTNGCFTSACTLQPLAIPLTPGFPDNRCDQTGVVTQDVACAIVNSGNLSTPWTFKDKTSGSTINTHGPSELYEGGLDLSGLGFGEACFSTVLLNTRSSPSGTSALQDFALGSFGSCTSGITTTPQAGGTPGGGAIPITIGASARVAVRDHADITVSGIQGTFGGTVKFFLCGPLALTTTTNCSTGGVQIGAAAGETVSGNAGTASLNSVDATLTSAGRYCWRAEYSGDTAKQVPGSTDPSKSVADGGTTSECFSIGPETPALSTLASCSPLTGGKCVLTATLSDTATLSGTAKQPGTDGLGTGGTINATAATQAAAGGSITWTAYGPNSCVTVAMTATSRDVSGDNTYPTAAQTAVSFTPTAIGDYVFVASYSGNSPNTNSLSATPCPETATPKTETITVIGTSSSASKQRWLPNDRVVLTGDTNLNGTLTVTLYSGDNCGVTSGTAVTGQQYTFTVSNATSGSAFNTSNADPASTGHTTFYVGTKPDGTAGGAAGAYSWLVHYVDTTLTSPADQCETSTVSPITDKP